MIASKTPCAALVDLLLLSAATEPGEEAETMGIFEETTKLLETCFHDVWVEHGGGVPVEWPNQPFTAREPLHYVSLTILFGEGQQGSIGSRTLEFQSGVVVVQLFQPKNAGTRAAARLADAVAQMRYRQLVGQSVVVDTYEPRMVPVGRRADHLQANVQLRFRAQHVVTQTETTASTSN